MGKKSRRNRPNGLPPGAKSLGTLTQEQVDRLRPNMPWVTPKKSEEFIKILERHPEHKTGDMSAAWREWQELNGIDPDDPDACAEDNLKLLTNTKEAMSAGQG